MKERERKKDKCEDGKELVEKDKKSDPKNKHEKTNKTPIDQKCKKKKTSGEKERKKKMACKWCGDLFDHCLVHPSPFWKHALVKKQYLGDLELKMISEK